MPRRPRPVEDRFWEKVDKHGPIPSHRPELGQCWLWTSGVNNKGYGEFHLSGKSENCYAHRLSWIIHNGEIPNGMKVLHRCDTPRCVRGSHLFLGTQADNLHDAMEKGRMPILISGSQFHLNRKGVIA